MCKKKDSGYFHLLRNWSYRGRYIISGGSMCKMSRVTLSLHVLTVCIRGDVTIFELCVFTRDSAFLTKLSVLHIFLEHVTK